MKYFKLISDNAIIGAVSSNNFIRYQALNDCYIHCSEIEGEYISFQGSLYRDTWMRPIKMHERYIEVYAPEITEEEYNIYKQAIELNGFIEAERNEELMETPVEEILPDPIDVASVEFIRASKINEMSYECRKTIEHGFDLELKGQSQHFSLSIQDQLNLINLNEMARTQTSIPYHADNDICIFYTAEEIHTIVEAATNYKIYQTTYYNALKNYINALNDINSISAIQYGDPIPDEYKTDVLKSLEQ